MKCPKCEKPVETVRSETEVIELESRTGQPDDPFKKRIPGKTSRSVQPCGCPLTKIEFEKIAKEIR